MGTYYYLRLARHDFACPKAHHNAHSRPLTVTRSSSSKFQPAMPVATSSRRRRRAPSSDIEEDRPNNVAEAPVDSDDDAPVAPKSRKTKKRTQSDQQVDNDGELPDIISNFQDQPLTRMDLQKLGGVADDWNMIRKQVHTQHFSLMNEIGANVAEFADSEKSQKVRCCCLLFVVHS